jgi:hypothetical protein
MQYLFHVMQIDHTLHNIIGDRHLLDLSKFLLLFVKLVKKTTIFKIFSDKCIFISSNANAHIKNDVWMLEIADDLQLLHEILSVMMLASFYVIFNCYLLAYIFTLIDFTEPALTNQLDIFNVLLLYDKGQTSMLFEEVIELANL